MAIPLRTCPHCRGLGRIAMPSPKRAGLTVKQALCLAFLKQYIAERGCSPTFQEIAVAMHLSSKAGSARLLDGLERRGRIRRLSRAARSIILVEACDASQ